MTYRVVQFGSGVTGKKSGRAILHHPELELVGLVVTAPEKVGRDGGELLGTDPIGIAATADVDEAIDLDPDCVCFMGEGMGHAEECNELVSRFLASGSNVVTPSLYGALIPEVAKPEVREPLEKACAEGQTTCYVTGAFPGVWGFQLPIALLSQCDEITSIVMEELFDYNHYEQPFVLRDVLGFGMPPEYPTFEGVDSVVWFQPTFDYYATLLGVTFDRIEHRMEKATLDHPVAWSLGTLEPGTMVALKHDYVGIVDGVEFLTFGFVTRMHDDAGPQWNKPSKPNTHAYRYRFNGTPAWDCEIAIDRDDPNRGTAGVHAVQAIPVVCEAQPGLIGWSDMPPYSTRNIRPG